MPAPLEDLNRDHQCHFYQAPSGQRCGSPALKGEYYCYHHHLKHAKRTNRVLIDPEVTCMEIPPIEDRASIFIALAAVVHRLAENTIDTRRAGQMIYGLQVAMRALEPPPSQRTRTSPAANPQPAEAPSNQSCHPEQAQQADTTPPDPPAPKTIQITKDNLIYFLRSRHCAHCNAELFPAEELTFRRNAGARPEIIEEANPRMTVSQLIQGVRPRLPAPELIEEATPRLPAPEQPPTQAAIASTNEQEVVILKGVEEEAVILNAVKDLCISPTAPPSPPDAQPASINPTILPTLHAVAEEPLPRRRHALFCNWAWIYYPNGKVVRVVAYGSSSSPAANDDGAAELRMGLGRPHVDQPAGGRIASVGSS